MSFVVYTKKLNKAVEEHKLLATSEEQEIRAFFRKAEEASYGATTVRGTASDLLVLEEALEAYRGLKLMLELLSK